MFGLRFFVIYPPHIGVQELKQINKSLSPTMQAFLSALSVDIMSPLNAVCLNCLHLIPEHFDQTNLLIIQFLF